MRQLLLQRAAFIGKSLLWSLLFYLLTVAILDWKEVKMAFTPRDKDPDVAGSPYRHIPGQTKAATKIARKEIYIRYLQSAALMYLKLEKP